MTVDFVLHYLCIRVCFIFFIGGYDVIILFEKWDVPSNKKKRNGEFCKCE